MALKDLCLLLGKDRHGTLGGLWGTSQAGFHPEIVESHNRLVEEVLALRKRVGELERSIDNQGETPED